MDLAQNSLECCEFEKEVPLKQKWNSTDSDISSDVTEGPFNCNICLDSPQDPVVTLCGHLYCWPCIYKWINIRTASTGPTQCPVCKSVVSVRSLVPLYGHGSPAPGSDAKKKSLGVIVPRRPAACLLHTTNLSESERESSRVELPGPSIVSPTTGVVAEMVFARMFGGSDPVYSGMYRHRDPQRGSANRRMRRQELQVDKSLNRVSFFLFCCFLLCLFMF